MGGFNPGITIAEGFDLNLVYVWYAKSKRSEDQDCLAQFGKYDAKTRIGLLDLPGDHIVTFQEFVTHQTTRSPNDARKPDPELDTPDLWESYRRLIASAETSPCAAPIFAESPEEALKIRDDLQRRWVEGERGTITPVDRGNLMARLMGVLFVIDGGAAGYLAKIMVKRGGLLNATVGVALLLAGFPLFVLGGALLGGLRIEK